ncbi:MAG: hypothetical protein HY954_11885 [Deltaproteobacteria bacterium]|nr:hypothetical protein [Deltaproteobacteria bacterium]
MKLDLFIQKTSNIQLKNQLYRFAVVVIALAVVVNSYYTYRFLNEQRIVVIPPGGLDEKAAVWTSGADEAYLKMMTRYAMGLYLTYNPATVRTQYAELLSLYHPTSYNDGKNFLYDLAGKVEMSNIVSAFTLSGIEYVKKARNIYEIEAKGVRSLYSKGLKLDEKTKSFVLTSSFENGRFYITDIKDSEK